MPRKLAARLIASIAATTTATVKRRLDVAIIGAGIAGTAAALLLARQGHRVALFERTHRIGPVGAGFLLQPSGQAVLQRLGLLESCSASAERITELVAFTESGRRFSYLPYAKLDAGDQFALGVHRAHLFDVIHTALTPAGVDVQLGVDVSRYDVLTRRVSLTAEGRLLGPFDLAIVADGARSRLRAQSGLCRYEHEYGHAAIWSVGPCDAVRNQLYQRTRGTRRLCGILPIGDGLATLFWGLPRGGFETLRERGFEAWRDEVVAFEPKSAGIFSTARSFADVVFAPFRHVEMSAWHDGPVVFVGDAAHATSPHLGQGVNLALADVEALAACIDASSSIADALNRYDDDRRLMQRYYSLLTRVLSPLFQSDGRALGVLRDVGLPILCRLPPSRRLMLQTLAGTWQRSPSISE